MEQNASRGSWTFDQTEERLARIMRNIHDNCAATADEYSAPGNYVLGANIAGFVCVAAPMRSLGVICHRDAGVGTPPSPLVTLHLYGAYPFRIRFRVMGRYWE